MRDILPIDSRASTDFIDSTEGTGVQSLHEEFGVAIAEGIAKRAGKTAIENRIDRTKFRMRAVELERGHDAALVRSFDDLISGGQGKHGIERKAGRQRVGLRGKSFL